MWFIAARLQTVRGPLEDLGLNSVDRFHPMEFSPLGNDVLGRTYSPGMAGTFEIFESHD
ncbi:hypothetical protein EMPG_09373 [Blastomyces silverae]|uniref:Uncharacterized protein n=1 Tax=Blastomyces silverae TaxID=2060906 RepID=A0A0H1BS26_9EURO|nr:hypothetical protein EMPG_09373 [Blastomyces silverae]